MTTIEYQKKWREKNKEKRIEYGFKQRQNKFLKKMEDEKMNLNELIEVLLESEGNKQENNLELYLENKKKAIEIIFEEKKLMAEIVYKTTIRELKLNHKKTLVNIEKDKKQAIMNEIAEIELDEEEIILEIIENEQE